jgi:hypothetical protein
MPCEVTSCAFSQRRLPALPHCCRLAFWGGFAFFMLVVAYISFKRTPAFMKQPLYSLLHMKHGGQPFTHTDYAAANVPPGTFIPTEKPWGAGEAAYPNEWAAWDENFAGVQGPKDGHGAFADAEWLDAEQHERVERTGGEAWQRGEDGTLLPPRMQRLREQEQRQQQQRRQPDAPRTPRQEEQQLQQGGCGVVVGVVVGVVGVAESTGLQWGSHHCAIHGCSSVPCAVGVQAAPICSMVNARCCCCSCQAFRVSAGVQHARDGALYADVLLELT